MNGNSDRKVLAILEGGRSYLAFAATQLGLAVSCACIFTAAFGYRPAAVLLHSAYVLAFVGLQTLLLGSLTRVVSRLSFALARGLVVLVLGTSAAVLLAIYAANVISNVAWQTNIDHSLLVRAHAHLAGVAAAVQVPAFVLYAVLVALLALSCAAVHPFGASLTLALHRLFADDTSGGLLRSRRRALCALLWMLGFPTYLAFQSVVLFAPGAGDTWRGEVISSLFLDEGERRFRDKPHLLRASLLDSVARASYGARHVESGPNVVLIIADSMRAASAQVYGYGRPTTPFLSGLQAQGRLSRVELATSTCSDSLCGIISTLSARRFNNITYELFKLNDVLFDVGYRVDLILSGDHRWQDIRGLLGKSHHYFSDGYDSRASYSINDDRALLEKLRARPAFAGQPTFFFLHLMSTHGMGAKLEYEDLWRDDERHRAEWTRLRTTGVLSSARAQTHDERILQADGVIEQIFQILGDKGYLRNAFVVITADHGEALGEHGEWGHGMGVFQENLRIPLLVYDTDGDRVANKVFATQVDIAPTILGRLSLPVPSTWQGSSLLSPAEARYTYHQTHTAPYRFAVLRFDHGEIQKLLTAPDSGDPGHESEEIFDLVGDPGETKNLIDAVPAALREDLRAHLAEYRAVETRR